MANKKNENRPQYRTSDDDSLLNDAENFLFMIAGRTDRRRLLMKLIISYCKVNRNRIDELPKGTRQTFVDLLDTMSVIVGRKNLTKKASNLYALPNVKARVLDFMLKNVDTESIYEYKTEVCESRPFNRFNVDGWKRFSVISKKEIDIMKKKIQNMRKLEHRGDREIQSMGFDGVMERDKIGYSNVLPDEKIVRDAKTGKIIVAGRDIKDIEGKV